MLLLWKLPSFVELLFLLWHVLEVESPLQEELVLTPNIWHIPEKKERGGGFLGAFDRLQGRGGQLTNTEDFSKLVWAERLEFIVGNFLAALLWREKRKKRSGERAIMAMIMGATSMGMMVSTTPLSLPQPPTISFVNFLPPLPPYCCCFFFFFFVFKFWNKRKSTAILFEHQDPFLPSGRISQIVVGTPVMFSWTWLRARRWKKVLGLTFICGWAL